MQTDQRSGSNRDEAAYSWMVIAMLWFVCLLNYADCQAIFSVFSVLKQEFGMSDFQLGMIAGCFMWAYAVFGSVAGWITDLVSRSRVIVGALCFWSIITGATAYAHNYQTLLWLRTLGGWEKPSTFPLPCH